eukprot:4800470-Prorocentrum_lima.AAC.1
MLFRDIDRGQSHGKVVAKVVGYISPSFVLPFVCGEIGLRGRRRWQGGPTRRGRARHYLPTSACHCPKSPGDFTLLPHRLVSRYTMQPLMIDQMLA